MRSQGGSRSNELNLEFQIEPLPSSREFVLHTQKNRTGSADELRTLSDFFDLSHILSKLFLQLIRQDQELPWSRLT